MNDLWEAAQRYAELGYPVFPCVPGTKKPLTERGFHDATTDLEQIERWWEQTPNANIGIATEGLLVVDIDSKDNQWLADDEEKLLQLACGPLSLTARGGRQHLFRQPDGKDWRNTAGKIATKVDTRANGGYIIAPPSVLTGNRQYRWAPDMELDVPPAELPKPPPWLVDRLDELANSSPRVAASGDDSNKIPSGQRNSTLASLAGTMRRVGMSKAEISVALQQANADRCLPPLSLAEVERIAGSVSRYDPDQISVAVTEDHWSQVNEGKPESVDRLIDPGPFPNHLIRVPGFISDVMDYNLATATRPQQILALAGGIALQAVLAARKVRDERGNRTNLYIVSVADSGAGKEQARKVCRRILYQAGLDRLEANDEIASDAGLISAAESEPGCLFQIDEFGRFLRTIGDPKRAPHLYNALGVFMKLYSCADSSFRGKAYGDRKRVRMIDQPCVCLHGTSVPSHFYESLTADSMNDGFVARISVFESYEMPDRQRVPELEVPKSIVEAAKWWGDFQSGGNLYSQHPQPAVIRTTEEAGRIFDQFAAQVDDQLRRKVSGSSLWTRAEEKACRLALVYACSRDRDSPVIDEDAARWACELSEYLTWRLLYLASRWVSDGHFDARQKKVLRVVHNAGGEIGRRELSRRTQWLSQRERQEVIHNLLETGQLRERFEETSTKPKIVYVVS